MVLSSLSPSLQVSLYNSVLCPDLKRKLHASLSSLPFEAYTIHVLERNYTSTRGTERDGRSTVERSVLFRGGDDVASRFKHRLPKDTVSFKVSPDLEGEIRGRKFTFSSREPKDRSITPPPLQVMLLSLLFQTLVRKQTLDIRVKRHPRLEWKEMRIGVYPLSTEDVSLPFTYRCLTKEEVETIDSFFQP